MTLYPNTHVQVHPNKMVKSSKNIDILETICTLFIVSSILKQFLGETTFNTIYSINHLPSSILSNQTPCEHLFLILHIIHCFIYLVVHVLFISILIKERNLNLSLDYVIFLDIVLNINIIGVMILFLGVCISHMSHFWNIRGFPTLHPMTLQINLRLSYSHICLQSYFQILLQVPQVTLLYNFLIRLSNLWKPHNKIIS